MLLREGGDGPRRVIALRKTPTAESSEGTAAGRPGRLEGRASVPEGSVPGTPAGQQSADQGVDAY